MNEQDINNARDILRKMEGAKRKLSNCIAELNEVWIGASGTDAEDYVSLAIGKAHVALESIKQAETLINTAIGE